MNGLVEYIATSVYSNAANGYAGQMQNTQNYREFIPRNHSPDESYSSPPQPNGIREKKHSYRASYPQSVRETRDYVASDSYHRDGDFKSIPTGPFPTPAGRRPRRSSLRQPGIRRRNSTPPKHVHFSSADIVYEPIDTHDHHTIEEMLGMMELAPAPSPNSSIPLESSYSVVVRHTDAKRDYPRRVSPPQSLAETVRSLQAELVGDVVRPRASRSRTIGHASEKLKNGSPSRKNGHYEREARSDVQSRPRAMNRHDLCHEFRPVRRDAPPTRRYTMSHYETQTYHPGLARSESHVKPRPRGHTVPQVRSKRSSLEPEAILVNEQAWAPAKVVLRAPDIHHPHEVDFDQPVYVPNDGSVLHRSDAQRLPASPVSRRDKLFQNFPRMWF